MVDAEVTVNGNHPDPGDAGKTAGARDTTTGDAEATNGPRTSAANVSDGGPRTATGDVGATDGPRTAAANASDGGPRTATGDVEATDGPRTAAADASDGGPRTATGDVEATDGPRTATGDVEATDGPRTDATDGTKTGDAPRTAAAEAATGDMAQGIATADLQASGGAPRTAAADADAAVGGPRTEPADATKPSDAQQTAAADAAKADSARDAATAHTESATGGPRTAAAEAEAEATVRGPRTEPAETGASDGGPHTTVAAADATVGGRHTAAADAGAISSGPHTEETDAGASDGGPHTAATNAEITVNGKRTPIGEVPVHTTALDWLRGLGLTGCKEGCAEGECGACAILVARPGVGVPTDLVAINACLAPVGSLDGQEVWTAEGLGGAELHPVQREMAVRGGSQCGYCTPGFVCSMAAEYYRGDRATTGDHHAPNGFDIHALSGNLCRCTGYRPIRDAAHALGSPAESDPLAQRRKHNAPEAVATRWHSEGRDYLRPSGWEEALRLRRDRPDATFVAGSTDWGVEVNIRGVRADCVVALDRLPELQILEFAEDTLEIGAGLSLTEIERRLDGRVPLLSDLMPQFASRLIRNAATLGGNLGTGSPIGDSAPVLLALDAGVVLSSVDGDREVPLAEYFTGYRQSVRRPDELIRSVRIPLPLAGTTAFHKVAKRRFDDISSVAVAFALSLEDNRVRTVAIGLGGVAATPIRARDTEAALIGQPWTEETVRTAAEVLRGEGTPMDDHRASAAYRAATLGRSLLKLHADSLEGARA
ncbi:FAD binding domain-containing protein [Amycolatopsis jejuensis]|uniref:FAD binding domain-containing protein n=1 Tax=Amycolatopsis jejuensis TaxID=330084 RepID=UPI001FDF9916|nr:FAD binding domain-containing protein [Amycolatopsis jejuensis]